mmetsp:Transcript_12636/g.40704  ORF Transcript_12636/g.40704 Transcript_12636/m.40704 type:complete len:261 (+) Transcript_12636:114-896(+)
MPVRRLPRRRRRERPPRRRPRRPPARSAPRPRRGAACSPRRGPARRPWRPRWHRSRPAGPRCCRRAASPRPHTPREWRTAPLPEPPPTASPARSPPRFAPRPARPPSRHLPSTCVLRARSALLLLPPSPQLSRSTAPRTSPPRVGHSRLGAQHPLPLPGRPRHAPRAAPQRPRPRPRPRGRRLRPPLARLRPAPCSPSRSLQKHRRPRLSLRTTWRRLLLRSRRSSSTWFRRRRAWPRARRQMTISRRPPPSRPTPNCLQ